METKLTDKQKYHIRKVVQSFQALDSSFEPLFDVFGIGVVDSKLFDETYKLFDFSLELVEEMVNDRHRWIHWFIYDNDCGKSDNEAGYDNNLRKISDIEGLYELVEESWNPDKEIF